MKYDLNISLASPPSGQLNDPPPKMAMCDPIPRPPSRRYSSCKVPTLSSPFDPLPTPPAEHPPSPTLTGIDHELAAINLPPPFRFNQGTPLCTIHEDRKLTTTAKDWFLGRSSRRPRIKRSEASDDVRVASGSGAPRELGEPLNSYVLEGRGPYGGHARLLPSAQVGERVAPEIEEAMRQARLELIREEEEARAETGGEEQGWWRRRVAWMGRPALEVAPEATSEAAPESAPEATSDSAPETERAEAAEPNDVHPPDWNGSTYVDGREMHYCGPDFPCKLERKCVPSVAELRDKGIPVTPKEERKGSVLGRPVRALFGGKKRPEQEFRRPSSVEVIRYGESVTRFIVEESVSPDVESRGEVNVAHGADGGVKGEGSGKRKWRRWWASWRDHGGKMGWRRRIMVERADE